MNRVPSLDNGEWIWSLLAASEALIQHGEKELGLRYRVSLEYGW